MDRRQFLGTTTAAGLMGLHTDAAMAQAMAPASSYTIAVMRTPVLVSPTPQDLEDIRRRNMEALLDNLEKSMRGSSKPRLVVFPVLPLTSARRAVSGVPMSAVAIDLVSKPLDQGILKPVIEACRKHNCYVATSTQEVVPQLGNTYFHTGFIMGPEGLVLRSPKSQAQSAPEVSYLRDIEVDYKKMFGPDSIMPVKDTPIGKLACYVEGEAEVLECSRLLASKGAEVIAHTTLESDEAPWLALKQAIGYQCHVFLASAATSRMIYAKDPAGEWAGGSSTIVGPDGKVLASKGGKEEGFATAEINLAAIAEAKKKHGRNTTPAWHLYKDLYANGPKP